MCIVAIAWQLFKELPVVVLSNRDEFLHRPSQKAHHWQNGIWAGQDEQAGGTWLGMHLQTGRWAVVLNYREVVANKPVFGTSRGRLVTEFLRGTLSPMATARRLPLHAYDGFNLVMGDTTQAVLINNKGYAATALPAGLYVLSNGNPDDAWYKCERLRARVRQEILPLLATQHAWHEHAFEVLQDSVMSSDHQLPSTGVPHQVEKALSSIFIPSERMTSLFAKPYGTQVSTIMTLGQTNELVERWHH